MKICGVIAEYNPFHNGHKLQLESAKEKTGADFCVIIMSGMFTQRGDMAIAPKFTRTQMALSQGADVVIEMPACYALQPAEYFALGGVGILNGIGADYISYGTEAVSQKDRKIIDDFVKLTNHPTHKFEKQIRLNLGDGISYPQARAEAFKEISQYEDVSILKSPNAILEIAYRNAIHRFGSDIVPVPVPRVGDAYHESAPKSKIASATAIRNLILSKEPYDDFMPREAHAILKDFLADNAPGNANLLYPYFLHTLAVSPHTLRAIPDGNDELYNRMIKAVSQSSSLAEYIDNVSTKRFTSARISRGVMHSILNISSSFVNEIRKKLPLYAHILGVNKDKKDVLGIITKQASIPVFTSVANPNLKTDLQKRLLETDIAATNLYNFTFKNQHLYNQDYTQKLTMC